MADDGAGVMSSRARFQATPRIARAFLAGVAAYTRGLDFGTFQNTSPVPSEEAERDEEQKKERRSTAVGCLRHGPRQRTAGPPTSSSVYEPAIRRRKSQSAWNAQPPVGRCPDPGGEVPRLFVSCGSSTTTAPEQTLIPHRSPPPLTLFDSARPPPRHCFDFKCKSG